MSFIVISLAMLTVATAFVAVPLWRHGLHGSHGPVAGGEGGQAPKPPSRWPSSRSTVWVMAVVIPVTAAALYAWLGNWQVGMYGVAAAARTEVETMVASLAHRLKTTDQNDLKGWIMLGRSYLAMSRYAEAVQVFAQARRIAGDQNAEVLASYGEALVLADPTNLISKAAPLFEKALKEQPDNIKALWYSGLAALAQRNSALAISRWRKLLVLDLPPDYRKAVEDRIRAAGGTVAPVTARSSARL